MPMPMEEKSEDEGDTADTPITSSQDGNQAEVVKERSVAGLLARLKSYASLPWSVKPLEVSPLVCARHGWLSREPDTLGCVACGASLSVRLPAQTADNYGKQLMDTVTCLARSHSDDCPWQSDPMPDDTPLLPFSDPESDLQAFLKISESLAPISAAVSAHVRFTLQCPVVRDLMEFVRSRSDRLLSLPEDVRSKCCLLAVAGWSPTDVAGASSSPAAAAAAADQQPQSPKTTRLLCCCFCQRRVGLWNLNRSHGGSSATASAAGGGGGTPASGSVMGGASVVIEDASLSDGVEAGLSLGGSSMPAPSYALTEMIINRQLLFAKKQHSVSDWSLISNAGSEAASIRDMDDVQSVAGSTVSNVSAGEMASQMQDLDQQQQQGQLPAGNLLSLPMPQGCWAAGHLHQGGVGGGGGPGSTGGGDPDNWSTMTNADSDRRSVAAQSCGVGVGGGEDCDDGNGDGNGTAAAEGGGCGFGGGSVTSKRPRLDAGDDAFGSGGGGGVAVDVLALHWAWCPWRPGDPSEDWCRSVLSHPDLRRDGAEEGPPALPDASAADDGGGDED